MSQLKLTRRGKIVIGASVVLVSIGAATVMPVAIGNTTEASPYNLPAGWEWVDQQLADALSEGGAPDAAERDWAACITRHTIDTAEVRCPDGYSERW